MPDAVAHRVVHGGRAHVRPALIDDALVAEVTGLVALAPLHLPAALAGVAAARAKFPGVPQVACFDTAFHAALPEVAWRLPPPDRYPEVRRYGFHGLSYESVLLALGDAVPARVIVAHLGSGASLAAIRDGRSVDTTMGMTPAGGVVMGTRTGDLDPGVLTYLPRAKGLTPDALEDLVERESGLLALGGSADMADLLARRATDGRAARAAAAFVYGVRKAVGAYVAVLGGVDLLVFTGGIGERAPAIRAEVCAGLDVFGLALDGPRNAAGAGVIANPLLREPLRLEHVKPRLLGHWGTTPGLNFIYAHLNRVIVERDLDAIYIAGPEHGGPGVVASTWLEGTYSEVYPAVSRDAEGMPHLFKQFSFPGGIPSHVAPETPGSIHEGGELGYCLSHAFGAAFGETTRMSEAETLPGDDHVSRDGRVMEMLSEHQCQGWLEGYLLTGRHGFFSCYEAFIHIVDSMFNQHAKWLKTARAVPWRRPVSSLNYLLTSHVWRQDHNGFSHQDPGFIDHVVNKKADVIRVYLPPDANTLLSVTDHCLRSAGYVNVIVAGKQPAPQWLTMEEAVRHCTAGLGLWPWASNDEGGDPDVVMACAGDVPTLETLAAVDILRRELPELKVRTVNVVDLMRLQPTSEHPHGLSDAAFDGIFTADHPVIFAYHGYPWLIHRLTYRRTNHRNLHVRGYKEEGTTTTPFDMAVKNDLDRFHLVQDVIDRVPSLGSRAAHLRQRMAHKLVEHREYIEARGDDLPEIRDWRWGGGT